MPNGELAVFHLKFLKESSGYISLAFSHLKKEKRGGKKKVLLFYLSVIGSGSRDQAHYFK